MSVFADIGDVPPQQIWAGVVSRAVHGDRMTMGLIELDAGAVVPEHSHEPEQVGILLAGLVLAVTYVGGELAQTAIGLPQAATGMFQALLLFFLLATDVLIRFRIMPVRAVAARAAG